MNDHAPDIIEQLRFELDDLAEAIVRRHWEMTPELGARYGADGRQRCLEDARYHLRYLAEAVEAESPVLFADYVNWAWRLLQERGVPTTDLVRNIECLQAVLHERLSTTASDPVSQIVEFALAQLRGEFCEDDSVPQSHARGLVDGYLRALRQGNRAQAVQLIMDAVDGGVSVRDIYLDVLQPAQYELGRLWQINQLSVAEEHYCTAVTQMIMSQLYPRILGGEKSGRAMVCACIGGDLHEIGSRMIADLFELEGWDTHFLGANTPASGIVQIVQQRRADLVGLSATMTYHLPLVRQTIAAVRQRSAAAILVGGRPFNLAPDLWRQVGADGWASSAREAPSVAMRLLSKGNSP